MVVIPFLDYPSFTEEVLLDNIPLKMTFTWNATGSYWLLNITDPNNSMLLSGIKVVLNYDLIGDFCDRGLPAGRLFVIDESGSNAPIGYKDFVNERRLQLVFATSEELNVV